VLLAGIALGLFAGLVAGGSVGNMAATRLRWPALLFTAVIVRFAAEAALTAGIEWIDRFRLPIFAGAFAVLLVGVWANRRLPGMGPVFAGVLLNAIVIVVNGGSMIVWEPALVAAGFGPADLTPFYTLLAVPVTDPVFLLSAGPLGDVLPLPIPIIGTVASVGDVFIAAGLAFVVFSVLVRPRPGSLAPDVEAERLSGLAGAARLPRPLGARIAGSIGAETGLAQAAALERPLVLAGPGPGLAGPALAPLPADLGGGAAVVLPTPRIVVRARQHPFTRLALNGSFSALWVGQLISLFGDRVHQVAIAFLVYDATGSALAVAGVFLSATLPNLVLGPIAGTLVDRWDQREVMIVSDLLRAAVVLVVPVAASIDIVLVYPLVFVITSVSLFFRPARTAVVPRIVRDDELVTANSAIWMSETVADVVGYPLAAIFVAFLGASLPLAFWVDATTYMASAALIATMFVPPIVVRVAPIGVGIVAEMRAGWRFLRHETVLLANTLQGLVGQFTVGVLLVLTPIYAVEVLEASSVEREVRYALLEAGMGAGNLIGGFLIGLVGARLRKGRLVIIGYTAWGICIAALALTGQLSIAFGLMLGAGIANMVFIIPSQTLFQERTPPDLIGRVVGFRFSIVFGGMTIAMAIGGILAEMAGTGPVLALFGIVTALAGLAGLFVPAVRDA
jgi:predicted MFS family arabinose efflux permease